MLSLTVVRRNVSATRDDSGSLGGVGATSAPRLLVCILRTLRFIEQLECNEG